MGWKILFSFIFFLFVISSLVLYWFIPGNIIEFNLPHSNSNFSLNNFEGNSIQFYSNMRFPSSKISYKIYDCPLQKKNNMEEAFEILSNETVLNFYPIDSDEEIYVTCDSKTKMDEGMFIAGEGGPTKIIGAGDFNVIFNGKILLLKQIDCEKPNVELHELLHVLGFDHSNNPHNIMYNYSNCKQTIGEDIIQLIEELYSFEGYPDLSVKNISALMHGKYLDTNFTVRNIGLQNSKGSKMNIYADEKLVKEFDLEEIGVGNGRIITLSNLLVNQFSVEELTFIVEYNYEELNKKNNKKILQIKK
jgi:hypothetical protein